MSDEDNLIQLENVVLQVRDRLDAAKEKGQVELHLSLSAVEVLVCLSEILLTCKRGRS